MFNTSNAIRGLKSFCRTFLAGERERSSDRSPGPAGRLPVLEELEPRLLLSVDLRGYDCFVPSTIGWGQSFTVQGQVVNYGNSSVTKSFYQKFYLSNDMNWGDADDVYLGQYTHAADVYGYSYGPDWNKTLTLPSSPPSGYSWVGTYYIGMATDGDNNVGETNEYNNGPGAVGSTYDYDSFQSQGPDLVGTSFNSDEPLVWGQSFNVDASIKNQGVAQAGTSTAKFYLSSDATIAGADTYLGQRTIPSIAAGATHTFNNQSIKLPASPPAGFTGTDTVYVGMIVDAGNAISENSETNNRNQGTGLDRDMVSVVQPANLKGTFFDSQEPLAWGQSFTVDGKIKNDGPAAAGSSTVKFYMSSDNKISGQDYYLGARTVSSLASGATYTFNDHSLVLPDTPPTGFTANDGVNIGMIVDANGNVAESNEANNRNRGKGLDRDWVSITMPIDLVGAVFDSQEPLMWGQTFTVAGGIRNEGTVAAGASTAKFYLSANGVIDASDVYLGSRAIPGIAPATNHTFLSQSLTLPGTPPAGFTATDGVNIGMIVDAANAVAESDETNNSNRGLNFDRDWVRVTPPPDLIGTSFDSEEPLMWGQEFRVDGAIKNQGDNDAGTSRVKFYLSVNGVIDATDYYLGDRFVPAIASGQTFTFANKALTLPAAPPDGFLATGGVNIGMIVDGTNKVHEASETNNSNRGKDLDRDWVMITAAAPDLISTFLDSDEPLMWGQTFNVDGKIVNQGNANAGASTARFYLSANGVIDAGDEYLGSRAIPAINAGQTYIFNDQSLTLPGAPPAGFTPVDGVNIGIIVDADAAVTESNEANNRNRGKGLDRDWVRVAPPADLIGTFFDSDEPLQWGQAFNVSGTITNQGTGDAVASKVKFYLSSNGVIGRNDVFLGTLANPAIAAGGTFTFTDHSLTLPAAPPAGFTATDGVNIGMIIDVNRQVVELVESNNANQGKGLDRDWLTVTV